MIITWVDSAGTFVLDQTNGIDVIEGVIGLDMPPVSTFWEQRPTFDGSTVMNERYDPRVITLPLFFYDASGNARDKVAVLARRLVSVGRAGGELRVTQGARTRSLFEVRRTAGLEGMETPIGNWRRMGLELTAGDPWWYDAAQVQELVWASTTDFDEATVVFDDAAMPFDGGDSVVVSVDGDVEAYPWFVITGPFTDLSVSNSTTGQAFQLATSLAAGSTLVVDARPGSRGPFLNSATRPDWSLLTTPSRLFTLSTGTNSIAVGASGDTADSKVEMRWRPRFATP